MENFCTRPSRSKCNSKKRRCVHKNLLWVGLAILVGCIVVNAIFNYGSSRLPQQLLWKEFLLLLQNKGWLFLFLFAGVLVPVVEELSFRLWGMIFVNGKRWLFIVWLLLFTSYLEVVCHLNFNLFEGWILVLPLSFVCVFYLVRNEKLKLTLMVHTTAIVFALCHLTGFESFSLIAAIGMLQMYGLALLCTYLVLNFGIVFSILFHILYNSIPLFAAYLTMSMWGATLNGEKVDLTARQVGEFDCCMKSDRMGPTSIFYGTKPEVAHKLIRYDYNKKNADPQTSPLFRVNNSKSLFCEIDAVWKDNSSEIDYLQIVREMERGGWIALDSVYEPIVMVGIDNIERVNAWSGKDTEPLQFFSDYLSQIYELPTQLVWDINENFPIRFDKDSLLSANSQNEAIQYLRHLGLSVTFSEIQSRLVVTISE